MTAGNPTIRFVRMLWVAAAARGRAMWRQDVDDSAFEPVADEATLASWLDRRGPSLLLLHDPFCPISGAAFRQVARLPGPIGLVDVAAAPELSDAVEARTGIRHESPQIILLRDGAPVWSASHYRITESGITEAIARTEPAEGAVTASNG